MKKIFLWLMVCIMIFSSGCVEKKPNITATNDNKIDRYLIYNMGEIPNDLLLLNSSEVRERDLLLSLFEGLVKVDEYGKVMPGLADSWTLSNDKITYTFKLRDNTKWSDGEAITANDFVEFFKDILNSKEDNIYAYELYPIFGAEEYRNNKKSFNGVAIRAVDDKTLEFRLNSPCSSFLEILTEPIFTLRKVDSNLKNWKENYKNIAYSGPFKVDGISNGDITLIKNDCYYEKDEVMSDKLYIRGSSSSETALAEYTNNKINIFVNPPISEGGKLIENEEAEVVPIESGSSINFNLKKGGITSNVNFRKALSSVIDRENLVENDLNNYATSASAYVPSYSKSNSKNENSLVSEKGDIELGKKLLTDSKYDKKENVKLVYLNNSENKKIVDAVAKDIDENLDVNLSCKGYSEMDLNDIVKSGDYNMILINYNSLYDDPMAMLQAWTSASQLNKYGYKSNDFDNLISKANLENDESKRQEYLQQAEELLIKDMPTIPIYFHNVVLCKKPSIEGVYVTTEGNVKLDRAYVKN